MVCKCPRLSWSTQSCLTLCNQMGYIVHGILQARILEWAAFPFFRGSFQFSSVAQSCPTLCDPRDKTQVSHIAGGFVTSWATRESWRGPSHIKIFTLATNVLITWRRKWKPIPVLLPGKSHGQRSLVGCSPWGHEELDTYWAALLSLFTFMHWRRKRQSTPVFLPGESQEQQSLVGCRLCGCTVGHDWSDLAAAACIYIY